jgi:deoxyadenosine/deoxycytidine kinase
MQINSTIPINGTAVNAVSVQNLRAGGNSSLNRTNLIEIIGPPGVGKSTLYNSLIQKWNRKSSWKYNHNIQSGNTSLSKVKSWLDKGFRDLTGKKRSEKVSVRHGFEFAKNHHELADFLWSFLSDKRTNSGNENNKRFRSAYFLFKDFCRLQYIIENGREKPFVIEEGLLQKSFLLNQDKQFMYDSISTYIELIPLPRAIIYLNTGSVDIILNRIKNRRKTIASHIGLNDSELYADLETWQYMFGIIIAKMEEKGVEVYRVNGENPVNNNVRLLLQYLENMQVTDIL